MINGKSVTAIVLVAGNSTRFGKNKNKNLELINGKSVLSYSLKEFNDNGYVDNIIVTVKKEDMDNVKMIIKEQLLIKKIDIVFGGSTRQQSVYNSIKDTKADIVIIHDGARPAIKQEYISECIESMEDFKGATVGVKSKDTIKICDDNGVVLETTKRANTYLIQTPQCFERETLVKLHERFKGNEEITDDCMVLEKGGYKIKVVEGDYTNIKVTTFDDLHLVEE